MKTYLIQLGFFVAGFSLAVYWLGFRFKDVIARFFAPKKRSKAIPRGTAPRKRGRPKKEQAAPDATPLYL